ncbi:MAG: hypothetical protein J6T86_02350 [Bacteroidales bacterium]|nr:hypothetical protein [Bacteroidales bacterium]
MYPNDGQAAPRSLTLFFALSLGLLCFLCLLPAPTQAQRGKPLMLEFPTNLYGDNIQHLACDTDGLCVFYSKDQEDSSFFHLLYYDRNFQLQHHLQYALSSELNLEAAAYGDKTIYFLFQNKIKKKRSDQGLLVRFDCAKRQTDSVSVNGLPSDGVHRMKASRSLILFSSISNGKRSNLYYLHAGSTLAIGLSIPDAISYEIEDFGLDTTRHHVLAALKSTPNNSTLIWLCETDYDRNIQHVTELPDTLQFRCESIRLALTDSGRWFLAGTYENLTNHVVEGVYTLPYHDGTFDSLRQHQYSAASIITNNNSPFLHTGGKIIPHGDRLAFITETVSPEYRDRPVYYYGVMTYEYSFTGYRYASSDVFVFDTTGQEEWYYNFHYEDILSQQVGSYLNLSFIGDHYLLYYTRGNELVTMLTNAQDEIIDSKRSSSLFPNSSTSYSYDGTILKPWYGDYFLLSGQKYNAKSSRSNATYFIHKLWYH